MYLDTRNLQDEIDELEALEKPSDFDTGRLSSLCELRDEVGSGWKDGVTLIPDYKWEEYAQETAYDLGFIDRDSEIGYYVDWERWAEDMRQDYATVELEGSTFLYRQQ